MLTLAMVFVLRWKIWAIAQRHLARFKPETGGNDQCDNDQWSL